MTTRSTVSFLLCASLLAVGNAWSTPIAILNAGFEDPPTASFGGAINDWTILGDAGAWNINAMPLGFWTVPAPEGNQVATLVGVGVPGPGTLSQVVGVLAADTIYTFSGMVGHPIGFSSGTIYTAQLLAGGNILATTSGTGPEGSFIGFEVRVQQRGLAVPRDATRSRALQQSSPNSIRRHRLGLRRRWNGSAGTSVNRPILVGARGGTPESSPHAMMTDPTTYRVSSPIALQAHSLFQRLRLNHRAAQQGVQADEAR